MIQKQRTLFYFVGEQVFKDLQEAQAADLVGMMGECAWTSEHKQSVAAWLLVHQEQVIDTLTTTPRSRLKARKSHGATRKPRAKTENPKNHSNPS